MTANAARTLTRRASAVLPETQQVNFLFDASLLLGHVNPQVAAVLGRKALQVSDKPFAVLPRGAAAALCRKCGVPFPPEVFASGRIMRFPRHYARRKRRTTGPRSNRAAVLYDCSLCGFTTVKPFYDIPAAHQSLQQAGGGSGHFTKALDYAAGSSDYPQQSTSTFTGSRTTKVPADTKSAAKSCLNDMVVDVSNVSEAHVQASTASGHATVQGTLPSAHPSCLSPLSSSVQSTMQMVGQTASALARGGHSQSMPPEGHQFVSDSDGFAQMSVDHTQPVRIKFSQGDDSDEATAAPLQTVLNVASPSKSSALDVALLAKCPFVGPSSLGGCNPSAVRLQDVPRAFTEHEGSCPGGKPGPPVGVPAVHTIAGEQPMHGLPVPWEEERHARNPPSLSLCHKEGGDGCQKAGRHRKHARVSWNDDLEEVQYIQQSQQKNISPVGCSAGEAEQSRRRIQTWFRMGRSWKRASL